MRQYSLQELQAKKTLATGQADDLKVETRTTRVWLSRCTVDDGEPYNNKVSVEKYQNGRWETIETYQAQ